MDATNVTISELTTQMMNEARRLGFSEAIIWRNWMHRAGMVAKYYWEQGVCLYDPAVTEAFVQENRQRCDSGSVSKNYLKQIRQIAGRLNEFFLTGTLRMDTMITAYLSSLLTEKGYSSATWNNRLAALKVFVAYAAACCPEYIALSTELAAIKAQRNDPFSKVEYLSEEVVRVLLQEPGAATKLGLRNRMMLIFL